MAAHDALLIRVVLDILEQFAFMFGEPEEAEPVADDGKVYYEATITFDSGSDQGLLRIAASASLCNEIAENYLGMEADELGSDASEDAIKELANVLVGSYTAEKLGVGVCCKLTSPIASKVDAARINQIVALEGAHRFCVDDHLFFVVLE